MTADLQATQLAEAALDQAWAADDPQWPGAAVKRLLELLEKADRLLPPGGVKRIEKGIRRPSGKIARVGDAFPGRFTRVVITWPVNDLEPNDNWPIYYGPWKELPL